jgi:hypothetical protein
VPPEASVYGKDTGPLASAHSTFASMGESPETTSETPAREASIGAVLVMVILPFTAWLLSSEVAPTLIE